LPENNTLGYLPSFLSLVKKKKVFSLVNNGLNRFFIAKGQTK
jgi:hypothetical protein